MENLFASNATIRIRVVPVGRLRRSVFTAALAQLRGQGSSISLADLTPNVSPESRSEFTAPTFPNGRIRLNFVTEHDHEFSTLEEFQASRAIFAILGILQHDSQTLVENVQVFNQYTVPLYPSALVCKCVAVGSSEPTSDDKALSDVAWVSLNPPGPTLISVMHDLTTTLLQKMNQMAQAIQQRSVIQSPPASILGSTAASDPTLTSPISPISSVQGSLSFQTKEQKMRKKTPARAAKLVGDLLLLAGKLPAAIDKYLEAMELLKPMNDPLWLGACMDGLYCTMLALRHIMPNAHEEIPSLPHPVRAWLKIAGDPEIESKFREIAVLYADAPVLLVDLILRTVLIVPQKAPALELITSALAHASLETLPIRVQLGFYIRIATCAFKFGFLRKQAMALAFALRALVHLFNTLTYSMNPNNVSNISAVKMDASTQFDYMNKLAHLYGLLTIDSVGWPAVQTLVLDLCIKLTDAVDDPSALNRLIVKCFKRLQSMLSMPVMLDIVARLQRSSSSGLFSDDRAGDALLIKDTARQFAFLKSIQISPTAPELVTHKRPTVNISDERDPFLYSAFAKQSSSATVLVAGESVSFSVELTNPFSFTVTLDSLVLLPVAPSQTNMDEDVAFKCDPIHVTLPPNGHTTVILRGTPERPGVLRLLGCAFRIFGVHDHCTLSQNDNESKTSGVKRLKLSAMDAIHESNSAHTVVSRPRSPAAKPGSSPTFLEWAVVASIPVIRIRPSGAAHRHIMLLEGESYDKMDLFMTNISASLRVSDLVVQVTETKGAGTEELVDETDAIAVHDKDKYELTYAAVTVGQNDPLSTDPVPSNKNDKHVLISQEIGPRETIQLPLEFFGKRNVTGVTIQAEYGERGSTHLRRATCEIRMTVVPSVVVVNTDLSRVACTADGRSEIRVGLDLVNQYSATMHVSVRGSSVDDSTEIPAGSARRLILTVPRCALTETDLTQRVPEIKSKQFIMTQHGLVPVNFRQRLMCFWLREYLVGQVSGTWVSDDGRRGVIDMGLINVHPDQIPIIWEQSIDVQVGQVDPICPYVYSVTLVLSNHADSIQSFLVQVHPDPLAPVRVLGQAVHLVCEMAAQSKREVKVQVLVTSPSSRVWLLCQVSRVGAEHAIEHVSKLGVVFPTP